jgi:hypothetical protein
MKNPLEITQDVLNGMIEIGGIPSNQSFYDEFNDRLKAALNLPHVGRTLVCETCGKDFQPIDKVNYHCQECQPCKAIDAN